MSKARDKHRLIIDEWFNNGFNGIAAYKKYNKHIKLDTTAKASFDRIKQSQHVKDYIEEKHVEAQELGKMTHEDVLAKLQNWVNSDITETIGLTDEEVRLLPLEVRRLINKYKIIRKSTYDAKGNLKSSYESIEFSFVSKEKAMEMICKHLGFYEADNNQKSIGINILAANDKHKKIIDNIVNG